MDKQLQEMIEAARSEYAGKNIVAFVGKAGFGKTVVSTLLYDTLAGSFSHQYRKDFDAIPIKGYDEIEHLHKRILKGRFPAATLPETKSEIIIEISSKAPLGTKIDLFLRDASGEDLRDVLFQKYDSYEELLENLFVKHKKDNESFGPLSYIPFAKLFVILIDCTKFAEWKSEQTRYVQLINSIADMKKAVNEATNDRIADSIAIIFTKADVLKNVMSNPEESESDPKDLLSKYMPLFQSVLNMRHSGKIDFFKFSIEGVEEASAEEAKLIAAEEFEEITIRNSTLLEDARRDAEETRINTINERVEKASERAKQEALAAGHPPDVAQQMAKKAGKEAKAIAEAEIKIDESYAQSYLSKISKEQHHDKYYKIKTPIKYSEREYIKFILWLIESTTR